MRKGLLAVVHAVAGFALLVSANQANAVLAVETFEGNDCSGVFGQGFDNCSFNDSPIIVKFGTGGEIEVNSIFPSIDGTEFDFTGFTAGSTEGTWTYTPDDATDPSIRYWVAKGGSEGFNLFWDQPAGPLDPDLATIQFHNEWFTPGGGISHLSFYDTNGVTVPEPGSIALLGAALVGLAAVARRRNRR